MDFINSYRPHSEGCGKLMVLHLSVHSWGGDTPLLVPGPFWWEIPSSPVTGSVFPDPVQRKGWYPGPVTGPVQSPVPGPVRGGGKRVPLSCTAPCWPGLKYSPARRELHIPVHRRASAYYSAGGTPLEVTQGDFLGR